MCQGKLHLHKVSLSGEGGLDILGWEKGYVIIIFLKIALNYFR